jgi:ferredoxin
MPRRRALCDQLRANGVAIEHACEKSCVCTTCHVLIRQGFASLRPASDEEEDQLGKAWGLEATSRLSCQVRVEQHRSGRGNSPLHAAISSASITEPVMQWTDTREIAAGLVGCARRNRSKDHPFHRSAPLGHGVARFRRRPAALEREDSRGHSDGVDRRSRVMSTCRKPDKADRCIRPAFPTPERATRDNSHSRNRCAGINSRAWHASCYV